MRYFFIIALFFFSIFQAYAWIGIIPENGDRITIPKWIEMANMVLSGVTQGGNAFSGKLIIGTNNNQPVGIETNNIERLTVLSGGNVGINTITPQQSLHVNGGSWFGIQSGATDALFSNLPNIVNIVSPTRITTNALTTPETAMRLLRAGTNGIKWNPAVDFQIGTYATGNNGLTRLNIRLTDGATFIPDTDVLTLQSNGRVGIGTITPSMTLQVNGNGQFGVGNLINIPPAPMNLISTAGGQLRTHLNLVNQGGGGGAGAAIDFYTYDGLGGTNPGARIAAIDNTFSADITFGTKVPGAATNLVQERMRIDNVGNVGIGIVAPLARLDVSGNFRLGTTGVTTTAAGTCRTAATVVSNVAPINMTCAGVPASTAVALYCNGSAAFTNPANTSLYCRPTGIANQIACNTTAPNGVSTIYTCLWMQP